MKAFLGFKQALLLIKCINSSRGRGVGGGESYSI